MSWLTLDNLIRCGLQPTQARQFLEPLGLACARFGIVKVGSLAGFIGQCRVESANFTKMEENLWYSNAERLWRIFPSRFSGPGDAAPFVNNPRALAMRVYGNRADLGNKSAEDGWDFRGSGPLQVTGRGHFEAAEADTGRPFAQQPKIARESATDAVLLGAWYFADKGCIAPAMAGNWDEVTRLIAPSMLKQEERAAYSEEAVRRLNEGIPSP